MNEIRALCVRRILAFSVDWLLIVAWGGLLGGLVMVTSDGVPPTLSSPWHGQAIGFFAMTLPVILYFSLCESSWMRATLGKRLLGLHVSAAGDTTLSRQPALLRNTLKFIPWELGHTVAQQAIYSEDAGLAAWVWVPLLIAFVVPAWWLGALLTSGRTPYDRWASAWVRRSG